MRAYRSPAETRLSTVFSAGTTRMQSDGARGRAQRAADALLEAILVAVQLVPAAEPRVDGPLVLGIALRDGLPEEVPERDAESLDLIEHAGPPYP